MVFVTVKGKMDTKGYLLQEDKCWLSIHYPFKRFEKAVQSDQSTIRMVFISVREKLASA